MMGVVAVVPNSGLSCLHFHGRDSVRLRSCSGAAQVVFSYAGVASQWSLGYVRGSELLGRKLGSGFRGRKWVEREKRCRCVMGEKKMGQSRGKKEADDRKVNPVGFFKEEGLKTKAFAQYLRERFWLLVNLSDD